MILATLFLKTSKPFQNIIVVAMVLTLITVSSTGFLIPIYETPILVQIFTVINFMRFHFESILIILFKGRCESNPIVFNSFGIKESQLSLNLYHLIIGAISFRIIALIILIFQTNSSLIFSKIKNIYLTTLKVS